MIKIEILVQPSEKPQNVENVMRLAATQVGVQLQITVTNNFAAYSRYAISPAQTPIIFINGNLEFAGRVPELNALKRRLVEVRNEMP
jgi:hypothetical protein